MGHSTISGLLAAAQASCFTDYLWLVLVAKLEADMSHLLQVVAAADLCMWSFMQIKQEKSVATGCRFKKGIALIIPRIVVCFQCRYTSLIVVQIWMY